MTRTKAIAGRRWWWWLFHAVMGLAIAVVLFLNWRLAQERRQRAALPELGEVPPFSLVAHNGQPLGLADLRGKIWIADFIFTHCAGPCPLMSRHMSDLQKRLTGLADVRLVSFTVDPARDTPAVLADYGRKFEADFARWFFLTGEKRAIFDLAHHGFKVTAIENTGPQRQPDEDDILHSTYFILVDRAGRIRGYFDATREGSLDQLVQAVHALARER